MHMAMYYQRSSEVQAPTDGQLQTLYLMNPNYLTFSDTQNHHQNNSLLFNPTTTTNSSMAQQFVGFTLAPSSNDPSCPSPVSLDLHQQELHGYNNIPRLYDTPMLELSYHSGNQRNMAQQVSQQGLSLSLSPHQNTAGLFHQMSSVKNPIGQDFPVKNHTSAASDFDYPVQGMILGSKYLKAAQDLLDEVASVGKHTETNEVMKDKAKMNVITKESNDEAEDLKSGVQTTHELTTAERQEMQTKKAKLNSMLDEVDQRCRQYHHQMQMTVCSFDRVAGIGSARSYTQLALKTILKQFKRLKSVIISQIKSINKKLGAEEHYNSDEKFEGSRLKLIDHQLLQQRALRQLGVMQNNAWRPQRGLPETAVSVLRAWLFEHFLHPYPKDSDKSLLAKQTGLTRSQVSNWFINARVRLWKPMVEEMYLEEMKNQEHDEKHNITNTSSDHHHHRHEKADIHKHSSPSSSSDQGKKIKQSQINHPQLHMTNILHSKQDNHQNPIIPNIVASPTGGLSASSINTSPISLLPRLGCTLDLKYPDERINLERPRINIVENNQDNSPSSILSSIEMEIKDHIMTGNEGFHRNHDYLSTLNNGDHVGYNNQGLGFGSYGVGEISRFNRERIQGNNNNNFSLSLGLPPASGNYVSSHRGNFEFVNRGVDQISTRVLDDRGVTNDDASSSNPSVDINDEILDFYNRTKRYASSHQMLPDFVA